VVKPGQPGTQEFTIVFGGPQDLTVRANSDANDNNNNQDPEISGIVVTLLCNLQDVSNMVKLCVQISQLFSDPKQ